MDLVWWLCILVVLSLVMGRVTGSPVENREGSPDVVAGAGEPAAAGQHAMDPHPGKEASEEQAQGEGGGAAGNGAREAAAEGRQASKAFVGDGEDLVKSTVHRVSSFWTFLVFTLNFIAPLACFVYCGRLALRCKPFSKRQGAVACYLAMLAHILTGVLVTIVAGSIPMTYYENTGWGNLSLATQIFLMLLFWASLLLCVWGVIRTAYKAEYFLQIMALLALGWDYERRMIYGVSSGNGVGSYLLVNLFYVLLIVILVTLASRSDAKITRQEALLYSVLSTLQNAGVKHFEEEIQTGPGKEV